MIESVYKRIAVAMVLTAIFFGGYFLYNKITSGVSVKNGRLYYKPANISFAMPETSWEFQRGYQIEQGDLVAYFERKVGKGKLYVNVTQINAKNKLTLENIQERSFGKLKAMGYKRAARNPKDRTFFFAGKDGEIVGFFFSHLPASYVLSSYVTGHIDVFPLYRKQWLELIDSFEPPLEAGP
jgi:hypothetical protein